MRRCSICKQTKDDAEFTKDCTRHDGFSPKCKDCQRVAGERRLPETRRRWVEANREKINAASREQRRRHALRVREYANKYNHEHADFYLAAKAVQRAIRHKLLLPAKECICVDCGKQARHYHHESYAEQERLNVTPLCASCHKRRHYVE